MTTNAEKEHPAKYLPQILPEYGGNPLIEALPPIMSVEDAVEALTVNPGYNEAEREMDAYYRFHAIRRLPRYFQPLYTHIDIEQRISCCIRQGYLGRNPIYSRNDHHLGKTTALGFTIIGIPVILIGTTKALPILQSEFRQARRGSGQGDLIWDRMPNDESWDILLRTMWKYQWTRKKSPLTEELKNLIYDESQGIIDIAVKLYAMAQVKAISDETECVTPVVIREVAAEKLRLVKPMLDALRSGNMKKIMQFEDIRPLSIEDYIAAHTSRLPLNDIDTREIAPLEEQVILKLLEFDIPSKTARQCVKKVMAGKNAGQTLASVVQKAFKMALRIEDETGGDSVMSPAYDTRDLRNISGDDPHAELKAAGAIAAGSEEW